MSELVLAIKSDRFGFQLQRGLDTNGGHLAGFYYALWEGEYVDRGSAENDPTWKQVIPYILLRHGGAVFSYKRGGGATETRLVGLRSIGIGGHVRQSDGADQHTALLRGAVREVNEEVLLPNEVHCSRRIGLLYDPSTPVGQVHVGVVYFWELDTKVIYPKETSVITDCAWLTPEQLAVTELEPWSKLIADAGVL